MLASLSVLTPSHPPVAICPAGRKPQTGAASGFCAWWSAPARPSILDTPSSPGLWFLSPSKSTRGHTSLMGPCFRARPRPPTAGPACGSPAHRSPRTAGRRGGGAVLASTPSTGAPLKPLGKGRGRGLGPGLWRGRAPHRLRLIRASLPTPPSPSFKVEDVARMKRRQARLDLSMSSLERLSRPLSFPTERFSELRRGRMRHRLPESPCGPPRPSSCRGGSRGPTRAAGLVPAPPCLPPGFLSRLAGPSARRATCTAPRAPGTRAAAGVLGVCRLGSRDTSRVLLPEGPCGLRLLPEVMQQPSEPLVALNRQDHGPPTCTGGYTQAAAKEQQSTCPPPDTRLHKAPRGHPGCRAHGQAPPWVLGWGANGSGDEGRGTGAARRTLRGRCDLVGGLDGLSEEAASGGDPKGSGSALVWSAPLPGLPGPAGPRGASL